jgi:hypothetical protein
MVNPSIKTTKPKSAVIRWLLDSDPAIRWQVLRDLTHESDAVVAVEQQRVSLEGWGARLLALQNLDGSWGDDITAPKWSSTLYTLMLLYYMGLDPSSEPAMKMVDLLRKGFTWAPEFGSTRFFEGEVEPCINGRVVALGAYFREPNDRLVDRLLSEQLEDGGWNCEAPQSSRSSFHTTINVLEGLLAYEQSVGTTPAVSEAQQRAQEYLLERRLLRRLSTGEVIDQKWTRFSFPTTWHYDVLRGLDYLRSAGVKPDERMAEAVAIVEKRQHQNGRWPVQNPHPFPYDLKLEGSSGTASWWNTLHALRVLDWYYTGVIQRA